LIQIFQIHDFLKRYYGNEFYRACLPEHQRRQEDTNFINTEVAEFTKKINWSVGVMEFL
jgi:hypothetical protein